MMIRFADFLTLRCCKSDTLSVETVLQIFNFDFFPRLVVYGTMLSHDAGQCSGPQLPVTTQHQGKQVMLYSVVTAKTILPNSRRT